MINQEMTSIGIALLSMQQAKRVRQFSFNDARQLSKEADRKASELWVPSYEAPTVKKGLKNMS